MQIISQFNQGSANAQELCQLRFGIRLFARLNVALFLVVVFSAVSYSSALAMYGLHLVWLAPAMLIILAVLCLLHRMAVPSAWVYVFASTVISMMVCALVHTLLHSYTYLMAVQSALAGFYIGFACLGHVQIKTIESSPVLDAAQLTSLNAAIRPHFFFNALNAVMGLIRSAPRQAEDLLQDTAELFRDLMNQNQHTLLSVAQELEITQRYVRIEQTRLLERLQLCWNIDQHLLEALIPSFTLQPLVENAIRHGIESINDGGVVTVKVYRVQQDLVIYVDNPCHADPFHASFPSGKQHNGLALHNIRQRLALMYNQNATLTVGYEAGKVYAMIQLPLEFEP